MAAETRLFDDVMKPPLLPFRATRPDAISHWGILMKPIGVVVFMSLPRDATFLEFNASLPQFRREPAVKKTANDAGSALD
jgi:hypothetical protein